MSYYQLLFALANEILLKKRPWAVVAGVLRNFVAARYLYSFQVNAEQATIHTLSWGYVEVIH